uniref:Ubiquitin carboxyl-terminal hydrolase n=1 Tax=Kalanchoe fedtschenkoi TaxID=63787 RepID=A0A7N0UTJ4_KALFE
METQTLVNGDSNRQSQNAIGSLFERKIEFHLARKPFSGVVNFDSKFQLETLNPAAPNANLGKGTMPTTQSPANKTEGMNLGRLGFDPEFSFGITLRRIGAGLENLGNTCFLNSVLQCLTYTEPLVAYLQSGRHQSSCQIAGFCALCAIQKHVSRALHATGRSLAPKDLVSNLRCISRTFRNARQEDAHEYMVHLLESMHRCCLPKGVPSESPSAYEKSLVHKIFGGRLQSQVQCMQCSYCSNKYDPFLDLSLEIARADTLQKALGHFTAKEQLDGGAKQYQCQQCKQKVRAVKQLTVHEAPYVLTVHLKRFCAHDPRQKIDKKVVFSPKLDLKPFVSGSHEGSLMYTLYGVLVHAGWSTRSGHYYCFVRTSTGMWHSLDDNRVVQVNERTVLDQKAYMLFYVRDRRNVTPKKPANVTLNEKMGSLANGNNMLLSLTKSFEGLRQNGSLETQVEENSVSAMKDVNHAINTKKEIKEGVSFMDSTTATNTSELNIIQPELAVVGLQNGSKIVNDPAVVESLPPSGSCNNIEASHGTGKIMSFDGNHPNTDVTLSASISLSCDMPQFTETVQPVISEKPPLTVGNGSLLGDGVSSGSSRETPSLEAGTNTSTEQPMNLPISRKMNNEIEVLECHSMIKHKKRLAKPFVIAMRLSINVMSGSTGRLCKKKLKQSGQTVLKNRSYDTEKILENTESTSHTVSHALPFRKRKVQSPSKEKLLVPAEEETHSKSTLLKKTIIGCDTEAQSSDVVLAANIPVNSGLINGLRGDDAKHCAHSVVEKVSSLQSGLKRALEEPIVACWDGTLSSNKDVLPMICESTSIGYVPDEWDEEYDRGKRKKVKLPKDSFDGTNPFQDFATIKATSKKSRDQSSSGNRPYRI